MVILLAIKYVINSFSVHYVGHLIGREGSGCIWEAFKWALMVAQSIKDCFNRSGVH